MKRKLIKFLLLVLILALSLPCTAYSAVGEIGTFGGISEGTRLPKTTEQILAKTNSSKKITSEDLVYKELVFLTGGPVEFEGIMRIKSSGTVDATKDVGTYTQTIDVLRSANSPDDVDVKRTITYLVNWRRITETNQVIKDFSVRTWIEQITIGGIVYTIDKKLSHSDKSILEDNTAGVVYSKGNISQSSVYRVGATSAKVTQNVSGTLYGYSSAWSATETQRLDVEVYNGTDGSGWQIQAQLRPSLFVTKTLQYSKNEPTAISFDGNYYEVLENNCVMAYDIFVTADRYSDTTNIPSGTISITKSNSFEQLPAPDLSYIKGHWAETDISKLFSMQILSGVPSQFIPNQKMTRSQFVTAVVKAIKLPIEQAPKVVSKSRPIPTFASDVESSRADFYYLKAAYTAGVARGVGDGRFGPDEPITRQEAFTILLRAIGLDSIGGTASNITSYVDNAEIADWARGSVYAATVLELVAPDEDGCLRPTEPITKAEGAALLNSTIDYLRQGISVDYVEHIVNYAN